MATYKYSALDENNTIVNGSMECDDTLQLKELLACDGKKLIKFNMALTSVGKSKKQKLKKVSSSQIATFCKQLSIITKSGISIIKGLGMVRDQSEDKKIKELSNVLFNNIQKGNSLSEAFRNSGFVLPLLLVNMVQVGEVSGNLDDIFKKMAEYYEKETRTIKKIISALIYPCILISVATGVVIIFTFFVLPDLVAIISENGTELPLITKVLMGSANFVAANFWYLLAGLALLLFIFKNYVPKEVKVTMKEKLIFNTPVVSRVAVDFLTSRVTRTMGILVNTGLSMIVIMDTLEKVVGNERVSRGISQAKDRVNTGESLSKSFEQIGFFDSMVINIINISEETGTLAESMIDIADYYEEKFDMGISKAIAMLEPMFTLIMGGVIAAILLSVMLPMFSMIGSLGQN